MLHKPVAGSYNSALAVGDGLGYPGDPPATRTFPFWSSVAEWLSRPILRAPVELQVPETGSYSSAVLRGSPPLITPPATRTVPLGRSVAECPTREPLMLPVTVQVPVAGSYSSALLSDPLM